jgi:hypothetical protein
MSNSDVALLGTVALILSVIAILLQVFNLGCADPISLFSVDTGTGPSPDLEDTGTGPLPDLEDTGTGPFPELEDTGTGPFSELEDTGTGPSPDLEDTGTGPFPELEDTGTGPSPDLEDTGTGPFPELEDTGTGPSPDLEDTDSCKEKSAYFLACGKCFDCTKCWDGLGRCAAIGNTGEIEGCDLKVFCPNDRSQLYEGCSCVMCCDV